MFTCNYSHARDNLASLLELAVDEISLLRFSAVKVARLYWLIKTLLNDTVKRLLMLSLLRSCKVMGRPIRSFLSDEIR